ncbi:MAG TPA: putative Ig domain-containing protein, partial [Terriglobales bacterium]
QGTPTVPGVYSVTIEAVDSSPKPLAADFTYLVNMRLPGAVLAQVAHTDLGGGGQNGAVTVATATATSVAYAYVGTLGTPGECPATGVKIVSLAQITNPTVVATAGGVAGAAQAQVRVATGLTSASFHSGGSGDLMAVTEQPCNPGQIGAGQTGVQFFDVSDPTHPALLGSWNSGLNGAGDVAIVPVAAQGKIYALVAVPGAEMAGGAQGDLRVLDITDPTNPQAIGDWSLLGATQQTVAQAGMGWDQRVFLASIELSSDSKTAYLSYWDGGVAVLDVSDPTKIATADSAVFLNHITYPITTIATTSTPTMPEGNTRQALPVAGGKYLLIADQVCASAMNKNPSDPSQTTPANPAVGVVCGANSAVPLTDSAGWGFVRTYTLGTGGSATLGGFFANPQSMSDPAPDQGIYTAHALAWNGDTAHPHAYVAWYSGGVEDLDVTAIAPPVRLAAFIPPDTTDPNGNRPGVNNPAKALVDGVAAYNPGGQPYVLASDINSGLWILREAPAAQFSILTTSLADGNVGVPYNAQLTAANAGLGGKEVTFRLANGSFPMPSGLALNTDGTITGTPAVAGTVTITFEATDSSGGDAEQSITMTIDQNLAILPLTSGTNQGTTGENFSLPLTVVNGTVPDTWSVVQGRLPAGITLDPTTGVLGGTATSSGTYNFTVAVTDSSVPAKSTTLPITLQFSGLTATDLALTDANLGVAYSATITMANGTGPFSPALASGTLPPGLSLSPSASSTRQWLISGTPTAAGPYKFAVRVTDAAGQQAVLPFQMTVQPFAIVPDVLATGVEGLGYKDQLATQGGIGPFQFDLVLGQLPPGLTFSFDGFIYGVPASGSAGDYTFGVAVHDANGLTATRSYTITIFNPNVFAITTVALPTATAGQQVNDVITANFGTPPYTFSLQSGTLPSGITLNPNGVLEGVPSVASSGTYSFTILVRDSLGLTATRHFSWVVVN